MKFLVNLRNVSTTAIKVALTPTNSKQFLPMAL